MALLIAVLLPSIPLHAQCSMCRAVLETEASGEAAQGLNDGIVYLMVIPYILVGLAIFLVYTRFRNKKARTGQAG